MSSNRIRKRQAAEQLFMHLQSKNLTRSEIDIVKMLMLTCRNETAAEKLFITEKTVKFHVSNIHKKLDVLNRAELFKYCYGYMIDRM